MTKTERAEAARAKYQQERAKILAQRKRRYREDKAFRERAKERYRERYRNDPKYAAKTLQRAKERYRRLKRQAQGEA